MLPYTSNGHESRSLTGWLGSRVSHESAGPVVIAMVHRASALFTWLLAGGPSSSLTVGCRPQFLAVCVFRPGQKPRSFITWYLKWRSLASLTYYWSQRWPWYSVGGHSTKKLTPGGGDHRGPSWSLATPEIWTRDEGIYFWFQYTLNPASRG